jgi:DNA repair exonuclease SbcCD nuclease subunit
VGYWALGHIHDRTVQPLGPGRWWAYPGNLQGRSTKATECGPKGALVVPILTEGFGKPQFHACDTVRFVRSDVDVSGADNVGDALDLVADHLADVEQQADGRSLVARLRLTGASAAHHTLATQSDLLDLAREQNTTGALISTVEVATRPRVDRDQVMARDNLQSDIVRTLDDVADPDALLLDLVRNHVTGLAEARLQKQLEADPTLAKALLNRVETLLIDVLEDPS